MGIPLEKLRTRTCKSGEKPRHSDFCLVNVDGVQKPGMIIEFDRKNGFTVLLDGESERRSGLNWTTVNWLLTDEELLTHFS